jgi:hypothetical protein
MSYRCLEDYCLLVPRVKAKQTNFLSSPLKLLESFGCDKQLSHNQVEPTVSSVTENCITKGFKILEACDLTLSSVKLVDQEVPS